MKKFFSLVLALVMALSLTTVAWGADPTTVTDDAGLRAAVAAGGEVLVNGNITLTSKITIDKAVTIKAADPVNNPVTITAYADNDAITINNGGTLTLGKGVTVTSSVNSGFYVLTGGTLLVEGATITSTATANTLVDVDGGTVTVSSGSVYSPKTTVFSVRNNGTLDIDGGSVYNTEAGDKVAAYASSGGTINVNGGEVYSETSSALRVMSKNSSTNGTINIYGGTIESDDGFVGVFADVGTINVYGGTIENIVDSTGGTVNIYGGDIAAVEKSTGTNGAVNVYGGTFEDPASAEPFLAPNLTLTTDGVVVAEDGAVLGAKYDMVTTDAAQTKTVGVTVATFKANAPKDTNKDGLLDKDGNVKYVVFSNMNDKYFVQVNSVSDADYAVYQTGTKTLFGYFNEVTTPFYEGDGVAFYDFGEKCGQYDDEPVADTKYYTFQGDLYKTVKTSGTNLMVGNILTPVEKMDDEWVDHVPAFTYDKDYKVVGVKCAECGTEAVIYANFASVPKADKADAVKVNDNDYYVWLEGPGAVVDTETKVESAETFDAGIALYVGMSVMAAAGSAVVIGKKKD